MREKQQAEQRIKQLEQQVAKQQSQQREAAPTASAMQPAQPPLPPEDDPAADEEVWMEARTAKGYKYFYNIKTQETNWTAPPGAKIYQEGKKESGKVTAAKGATEPQPEWQKLLTSEGYEYWYDSTTGATSWEKPI